MAKYLKKFETTAAYQAAESSLILPNVSLTVDNNTVHYNPISPTPPAPTHDYVEIAGIKWATMNIGANSVTDSGLFFQWGDTQGYTAAQVGEGEGQKYFGYDDYKFYDDGSYTKYNYTDKLYALQSSDDAATAAWGGNWRIPTNEEFDAIVSSTTTAWTNDYQGSGVAGLVLTDNTDSSKILFFPAAGGCDNGSVHNVGTSSCYWTSEPDYYDGAGYAYYFACDEYGGGWTDTNRVYGYTVRGILDDSNN